MARVSFAVHAMPFHLFLPFPIRSCPTDVSLPPPLSLAGFAVKHDRHGDQQALVALIPTPACTRPPSQEHDSPDSSSTVTEGCKERLKGLLARSGHTATLLDDLGLLVILGGLLDDDRPDDTVCPMTPLIIRLPSLEVLQPRVSGTPPASRYRHAAAQVCWPAIAESVAEQLLGTGGGLSSHGGGRDALEAGGLIAMYGGCEGRKVFGGPELPLLWVSPCGLEVRWASATASGAPPPPCFHHCLVPLRRSPVLLLLGGETSADHMPERAVYTLWLPTMTWEKRPTRPAGREPAPDPGARWLHICELLPDRPGRPEEVVLVGGIGKDSNVCNMSPFVLDTEAMLWRKGAPEILPGSAPPAPPSLPVPRHRAASTRVGRFLIVHGGCPARGSWLHDTWALDLASLQWHQPADVHGRPRQHSRIAGHSLAGQVAFGGCIRALFEITPVAKMDLLLLGAPPPVLQGPWERGAAPGGQQARQGERDSRLSGAQPLGRLLLQDELVQLLHHPQHGILGMPAGIYDDIMAGSSSGSESSGSGGSDSSNSDIEGGDT
mmetsp:Transcript_37474/g.105821  ORF Transcript_37474/g.105821 Transcript_37474/m.105821 type:complete len:549 (+) Transcript_37474:76-1722(+)